MTYDARAVANDLIRRAKNSGKGFTPLQLQKLVYFAHAWMLGMYSRPLVEQNFIAWRLGPVVPDLYHELKGYGAKPVLKEIRGYDYPSYDPDEEDLVRQIFEKYGRISGARLSALTHTRGSPWYQVYYHPRSGPNPVIRNSLIQAYHQKALEEANGASRSG